jgi:hypothetical protein
MKFKRKHPGYPALSILPLIAVLACGCSSVNVRSEGIGGPVPRGRSQVVATGLVEVLRPDAVPDPECVAVAELKGRTSTRGGRNELFTELREEAGRYRANVVHIVDLGPPSFGDRLLTAVGSAFVMGAFASVASIYVGEDAASGWDIDTGGGVLVAKAVAMDCPPSEAQRRMETTLAGFARPQAPTEGLETPEMTALVSTDVSHSGLVVSGVLSTYDNLLPSTYVVVSAAGKRVFADADGRYSLTALVPSAECKDVAVTITLLSPGSEDVVEERLLGQCGEHRVDVWR